jgi:hypothetical protein
MVFSEAVSKLTQKIDASKLPIFAAKIELKALERDFAFNVHENPAALSFDNKINKYVNMPGIKRRLSKDSDASFIEPQWLPKATGSADAYVKKLNRSVELKERIGRARTASNARKAPMLQQQTTHGSQRSDQCNTPSLGLVLGEEGEVIDTINIAPVAPSWGMQKTAFPPVSAAASALEIPKTDINLPTDSLCCAKRLDGRKH